MQYKGYEIGYEILPREPGSSRMFRGWVRLPATNRIDPQPVTIHFCDDERLMVDDALEDAADWVDEHTERGDRMLGAAAPAEATRSCEQCVCANVCQHKARLDEAMFGAAGYDPTPLGVGGPCDERIARARVLLACQCRWYKEDE